jgi:hypothetical protein
MSWVEQNMETSKPVRGIIVAKEITNDLRLAASRISGVRLIEATRLAQYAASLRRTVPTVEGGAATVRA